MKPRLKMILWIAILVLGITSFLLSRRREGFAVRRAPPPKRAPAPPPLASRTDPAVQTAVTAQQNVNKLINYLVAWRKDAMYSTNPSQVKQISLEDYNKITPLQNFIKLASSEQPPAYVLEQINGVQASTINPLISKYQLPLPPIPVPVQTNPNFALTVQPYKTLAPFVNYTYF